MQIELELLAPAKNKNIGIAAINCGADAVYIAGDKFGARESAGNPIQDLVALINYAHKFKAKVYITINTILYDNEIKQAVKLINDVYEAGADAVIIQDIGLTSHPDMPPIPLFASTQCNITTPEQAIFLESLGFKRLILARELSLEQISVIKKSVKIDLESFIHGALCVCYSGQCYMSCKLTGRSANRGECAQVCRSNYSLCNEQGAIFIKDKPLLSLKDLNLSAKIPQLIKSGITSFKIEGRLKNESYVKNIVKYYRNILDEYLTYNPLYTTASLGSDYSTSFTPNPDLTFNRGYTELFINGDRQIWNSGDGAKYLGEYIGKVIRRTNTSKGSTQFEYDIPKGKNDIAENNTESTLPTPIVNGDGLCFASADGTIIGARANNCIGREVCVFEKIDIRAGDKIFRNYNSAFEKEIETLSPQRFININLSFIESPEHNYKILANWNDKSHLSSLEYAIDCPVQSAQNEDTAKKSIISQLSKSAECYRFDVKKIQCANIPFFPISTLNKFRRDIAQAITKKIIEEIAEEIAICRKTINADKKFISESLKTAAFFTGKRLSYSANCSNSFSRAVYKASGAQEIDDAYEISFKNNAVKAIGQNELMRTKYCIKFELGLCQNRYANKNYRNAIFKSHIPILQTAESLYLLNGNNKLELKFDCKNCEMIIIG